MPPGFRAFLAALLLAACLLAPTAAAEASQRSCRSADLRYPFEPGGPRTFGVFGLRIANGTCTTAHRVASAWMSRFETSFRAGRLALPRSVAHFRFTNLPAQAAQTFRERGQMGTTTVWFDYHIPNG